MCRWRAPDLIGEVAHRLALLHEEALSGWDSLLSIVQMPGGIPVATTAVGNSGATNAGLLAVSMLSMNDERLADALQAYRDELKEKVEQSNAELI